MLTAQNDSLTLDLTRALTEIISETNGINLSETLELMSTSESNRQKPVIQKLAVEFRNLLFQFQTASDIPQVSQVPARHEIRCRGDLDHRSRAIGGTQRTLESSAA